jgi:hypothetical protein
MRGGGALALAVNLCGRSLWALMGKVPLCKASTYREPMRTHTMDVRRQSMDEKYHRQVWVVAVFEIWIFKNSSVLDSNFIL